MINNIFMRMCVSENMETKDEDTTVALGINIPVDSSDFNQTIGTTSDSFYNLPYYLDPNLGMMGQLPSANVAYKINTFNEWNIEPHFLHVLPVSSTISSESYILMFGGLNPSSVLKKNPPALDHQDFVLGSTIFQYLLNSRLWKYYGTMIEPRCYHACISDGQHIYITGGYSLLKRKHGEMLALSSTDRLNLNNKQWSRCANMIIARASHAIISHNGCLYAFGGRDSIGNILSSVEVYYPEQDMWAEITFLPQPCMGLSATCIRDTVWIVGGITDCESADSTNCVLSTVYSFIPQTNRWCLMEPLPYGCAFSSCISDCNSLWLIGGCTSKNLKDSLISYSAVLQLTLHEKHSTWKEVTSLWYPRHALTAVLFDEYIYVLAGMESYNNCTSDKMEVINTTTNVCLELPNIPVSVTGCTSILILGETVNYICIKCGKNHAQAKKTSYLSQSESDSKHTKKDNVCETYKAFNSQENICPQDVNKNITPISESNLKSETILENSKAEDFDYKNIDETVTHREFLEQKDISSYIDRKNEENKIDKNFKYRASMEIFLNPNEKGNVLPKNKLATKWLNYFHTLTISDEEIHNEIFQSDAPKLSIETKMDDNEFQKNCKRSEVKYFVKEMKVNNKRDNRNSLYSHDKSFIYVQSNLKPEMLNTVSNVKNYENTCLQESFESISTSRESKSEEDTLSLHFPTENIALDEESFPVILLMGGEYQEDNNKSRYILSYHCGKNFWKYVGYMPDYRCHHCLVFWNNKIYIIGGFDSKNSKLYENITRRVLCFDISKKIWQQVTEMNFSRAYHCAIILKNKIYVLGGRDKLGNILDSVEVYNESINEWKECKCLPYPVLGAVVAVIKNVLYLFGGITYEEENEIISCNSAVFQPEDESWSVGPNLPIPLAFSGISSSSKHVWLFGGIQEEEGNIVSSKNILQFDVYTKIWKKIAELSVPRHAPVAVSLGTTVFVIGGYSTQVKKEVLTCEKIDVLNNEVLIQESLPIAVSGRSGIVITKVDKNDMHVVSA